MADLTDPTIAPPSASELIYQSSMSNTTDPTVQTLGTPPSAPDAPDATGIQVPEYQAADLSNPLTDQLTDFASDGLNNFSRWDADVVRQGIDLVNQDIAEGWETASSDMDEHHSSRGLVGSDVETWNRRKAILDRERERARRLFDINVAQANTYAQDRASAAQIGQQIGDFIRTNNLDAENQARYGAEFARLTGRDAAQDLDADFQRRMATAQFGQGQYEFGQQFGLAGQNLALQQRAQQLQALGMDRDQAFRYAQLEQSQSQFTSGLEEQRAARLQQFGLSTQELDLRAQQLQQEAALQGRSLDIEQARSEAELDLRSQQLVQEAQLQGRSLSIEEARQQAQMEQFESTLDFQRQQFLGQQQIDQRALELQALGLSQEDAYRYAQMEQQQSQFEAGLGQEAQQFQQQMALQQRAQDLQSLGMSQDEAFRYAQMEQNQAQFQASLQQRTQELMQQAELEGRSLDIQEAQYQAQIGLEGERLAESVRQFDLEIDQQEAQRLAEFDMFTEGLKSEELIARLDNESRERIQSGDSSVSLEIARLNAESQAASDLIRQSIAQLDADTRTQIANQELGVQERLGMLDNNTRIQLEQMSNETAAAISRGEIDGRIALQQLVGGQEAELQASRLAMEETLAGLDNASREKIAAWANANDLEITNLRNASAEQIASADNETRELINSAQLAAEERMATERTQMQETIAGMDNATREQIAEWANAIEQNAITAQSAGDDKRLIASVFDALARFAAASGETGAPPPLPSWLQDYI